MVQFSEEAGFYPGDNFVSNETSYLHPMPTLIEKGSPGGVYIGVGTEQNFSYIAATRPEIAFILDIRRENLLQHFLYKAVFTLSPDRTTFLSLTSREDERLTVGVPTGSATLPRAPPIPGAHKYERNFRHRRDTVQIKYLSRYICRACCNGEGDQDSEQGCAPDA